LTQKQQQPQPAGLHFFPVQVGPPTLYAVQRKSAFVGVLIFQALMVVCRSAEDDFRSIPLAILMGIGVLVGFWAWKDNMNITYICWWGVLSLAGLIVGIILAIFSFAVKVSTIVMLCIIPFSCFCGCALAWWLYVDYEEQYQTNDLLSSWLRYFRVLQDHSSMGVTHGAVVGAGAMAAAGAGTGSANGLLGNLFGGGTPQGSADLAKNQMMAGKGAANQHLAAAQEQGRGWWAQGSQQLAGQQKQAADQYAQARGQAADQWGLFSAQAGRQYGSLQNQAGQAYGNAQGQAAGINGWLAGIAAGPAAVPSSGGVDADISRDPFLTK